MTSLGQVAEVQETLQGQVMVDLVTSPGLAKFDLVTSQPAGLQFAGPVVWSKWSGCSAVVAEAAEAGGPHGPCGDLELSLENYEVWAILIFVEMTFGWGLAEVVCPLHPPPLHCSPTPPHYRTSPQDDCICQDTCQD